jgi:tetratricopeptide (TPR) repeat protein
VEQAERAFRLSPFDPLIWMPYNSLAYAHFAAGRFEEAAAAASRVIQSNPGFSVPYILLAAALASLGRSEDAIAVVQRLVEVQPGITDPSGPLRKPRKYWRVGKRFAPGRIAGTMTATRRLAAILAADVTGYSRLMGADEEGTLERLKALHRDLLDPKIAEHHGRIVKTTGDGLLVEFASVVDAVRCAVDVQQAILARYT